MLKPLLTRQVLEEIRQTSTMFSKLKALVDLEKFRAIIFNIVKEKTITRNSELLLPSMIPRAVEEFPAIAFVYGARNNKLKLRIHLKATSQSAIFWACVCEMKDNDAVFPSKDSRQVPVIVVLLTSRCPRIEIVK